MKIKNLLNKLYESSIDYIDSNTTQEIVGDLTIEVQEPRSSNLYMTVANPSIFQILEYAIKITKNDTIYSLELYRDGFDVGTYTIGLGIYYKGNLWSFIDFKLTSFQFEKFKNDLKDHLNDKDITGFKYPFILDDAFILDIYGYSYVLSFAKTTFKIPIEDHTLTRDEYIEFVNQLDKLNSKVNYNSGVYNNYRVYKDLDIENE